MPGGHSKHFYATSNGRRCRRHQNGGHLSREDIVEMMERQRKRNAIIYNFSNRENGLYSNRNGGKLKPTRFANLFSSSPNVEPMEPEEERRTPENDEGDNGQQQRETVVVGNCNEMDPGVVKNPNPLTPSQNEDKNVKRKVQETNDTDYQEVLNGSPSSTNGFISEDFLECYQRTHDEERVDYSPHTPESTPPPILPVTPHDGSEVSTEVSHEYITLTYVLEDNEQNDEFGASTF